MYYRKSILLYTPLSHLSFTSKCSPGVLDPATFMYSCTEFIPRTVCPTWDNRLVSGQVTCKLSKVDIVKIQQEINLVSIHYDKMSTCMYHWIVWPGTNIIK